jgi:hypothetical protein
LEEVHYETTVPTIRDRVVQTAAKLVLEPIFEVDFDPNAYGYRPKRSAQVETAGAHLKSAGIAIRPPRAWGRQSPAKPANEVITGPAPRVGCIIAQAGEPKWKLWRRYC